MGYESKLTSKGQTTIPVEIREHLKLKPGDLLEFVPQEHGVLIKARNRSALDLVGILGPPPNGRSVTVEEMEEAIGEAILERYERSL